MRSALGLLAKEGSVLVRQCGGGPLLAGRQVDQRENKERAPNEAKQPSNTIAAGQPVPETRRGEEIPDQQDFSQRGKQPQSPAPAIAYECDDGEKKPARIRQRNNPAINRQGNCERQRQPSYHGCHASSGAGGEPGGNDAEIFARCAHSKMPVGRMRLCIWRLRLWAFHKQASYGEA